MQGFGRGRAAKVGALLVAASLVVAACGGDDSDESEPSDDSTSDSTMATTADASDEDGADGADSTEGDATEGDATEGDATEGDSTEGDATEGDAAEGDAGMPDDADPDGVLTIGTFLDLIGGTNFDPAQSVTISDEEYLVQLYGTLLERNEDGSYEPWFAESVELVDPSTVAVTIRDGIQFSDGATYDAEAVRAGMLHIQDDSTEQSRPGQNALFRELEDITVEGPLELTFHLANPVGGEFYQVLAGRESMIVSPDADPATINTAPVGAGPFVLDDYTPEQSITMSRNENYFRPDEYQVGGLEFVHTPAGTPRANGLLANEIDLAFRIDVPDVPALETDPYEVEAFIEEQGYIVIQMCMTKPPLDDLDVRRALQIGLDRERMVELLTDGRGEPAYGFWPSESPNANPDLADALAYDPDGARELLEGKDVGPIEAYWPTNLAYDDLNEVLRVQLEDIGIEYVSVPSANVLAEFIEPQKPGILLVPGSRIGMDKYLRVFADGATQNLCDKDNSALVEQVLGIGALEPGDPARAELNQTVEAEIADQALEIPLIFDPTFIAWNGDTIGGDVEIGGMSNRYLLADVYVKG